jgi:chaperone required for assembly of F1-ATPase
MGELFETMEPHDAPQDPMAAARRNARPALRQRFYTHADVASGPAGGYVVRLDDKPVYTPARRPLAAPTLPLAQALAAEWEAQREQIDPAKMPLTRLANSIIDGVADAPVPVKAEIQKYLGSDLLFYRAESPQTLRERQARPARGSFTSCSLHRRCRQQATRSPRMPGGSVRCIPRQRSRARR